ncbi:MAG TPA: hypothetical protein VLB73_01480 [Patescibacteria group bacterium]|nr:hypothetical protein [Patescibacteria group bacterium]
MATKKHYFTKNNEKVGKKSGKPRGKYKKQGKTSQEDMIIPQSVPEIESKTQESPSFYRKITERLGKIRLIYSAQFSWKTIVLVIFFLVILGVSVWQGVLAGEKLLFLKNVVGERVKLSQDLKLWESIMAKYPGYRDAYFQAAVLSYRLGDREKEKTYLAKTLEIDPNYQPAKSLMAIK